MSYALELTKHIGDRTIHLVVTRATPDHCGTITMTERADGEEVSYVHLQLAAE